MTIDEAVNRILDFGAVGIAAPPQLAPFYVHFYLVDIEPPFVEVTFNPEWVDLGGLDPTDWVTSGGQREKTAAWLRDFLIDYRIELCPPSSEEKAKERLFARESPDVSAIDLRSPWDL